jgi:dTDP-glucose 4,6-dehydratase
MGTQVFLDAVKAVGVTKFVHVSKDEVYGELDFDPTTFLKSNGDGSHCFLLVSN